MCPCTIYMEVLGYLWDTTVEPLIKDTPNKGHNLRTKDKFQCTKWRLSYSFNTLLTSGKGQNGQKTMGPKRVRYSEVPLLMSLSYSIYHNNNYSLTFALCRHLVRVITLICPVI